MALLPMTLRRRLRSSGFTEDQTDALDEVSEAAASAARDGMAPDSQVNDEFTLLREEIHALRNDMVALRADFHALVWQLFGGIAALILAATGAIIAAIVAWG